MANYEPVKCAFCLSKPKLEIKFSKNGINGKVYRYVCNNSLCAGHHGSFLFTEQQAARIWNVSQSSKRSTGKRFMLTRQINDMDAN